MNGNIPKYNGYSRSTLIPPSLNAANIPRIKVLILPPKP